MHRSTHSMVDLFAQLGRPTSPGDIETFVARWSPLAGSVRLHEADFWNSSQAAFLREALGEDADWAEVVDQLNVEFHAPRHRGPRRAPTGA